MNASINKPVVICAADDNYAMCLAVMTTSLLENYAGKDGLSLYILEVGISSENKEKLLNGWKKYNVDVHLISIDSTRLAGLPISDHVSVAAYSRILMGDVLPLNLSKIIYLDSDLVVEGDIGRLWELDLESAICLAVQDVSAPYIDSEIALRNYHLCWRNLAAVQPIGNYRQLGLDPNAAYFNSGVMVIDMTKWRENSVKERLLECLKVNTKHVLWWDQYALNVVLHGRWRRLNPRWNQIPHAFQYPNWRESPLDEKLYIESTTNPHIIHFASPAKPWHHFYWHPRRENFFRYLRKTAWSGYKPKLGISDWNRFKRYYLKAKRNQLMQAAANFLSRQKLSG